MQKNKRFKNRRALKKARLLMIDDDEYQLEIINKEINQIKCHYSKRKKH